MSRARDGVHLVGEDLSHLLEQLVHRIVRVALGVVVELVAPLRAGAELDPLRLDGQQAARVSRHIKLGHYANAPVLCVAHHVRDVLLRVMARANAGERGSEVGEDLALHREAAKVGCMQVQHVELDGRHGVQEVFDQRHRKETPTTVDHQSTPRVIWLVLDGDDVVRQAPVTRRVDELRQALERICGTIDAAGLNGSRRRRRWDDS